MARNFTAALAILTLLGVAAEAIGQARIEEVIVTATKGERRALQPAFELSREEFVERAPVALTDIFEGIPSVGIRTNSRGEAVLRLRGSEERQTGIFLDGAPLSVPWDGRVDLSALPAGIIERVRVTPSAAPIEYGANSVLGVVDIQTPVTPGTGLQSLQAEAGAYGARSISVAAGARSGEVDWLFGGNWRRLGGEAVADTSVIPYGPTDDGARSNTDLGSASIFVAAGMEHDRGVVRASLLSVEADRGIANAGHVDPAIGSPRYWRYPHWRFDQFTLNAANDLGASMSLRSTLWVQHFEQTIDQYTDETYSVPGSSENDEDDTLGLRLVLERAFDSFDLRLVGNAQVTRHDQVDTDRLSGIAGPLHSYQQNIFSLGAEIDTSPLDDLVLSAALSYDLATTPRTGGRAAQDGLSDWAASVAASWYPGESWRIAGTLGQRTRFPTLRELYGEALGKFVLNADLRPETTLLGDLTVEWTSRSEEFSMRITPWLLRIDDTLSRRSVVLDGIRRRQRYNLAGSSGHGVEAGIAWTVDDRLDVRLNGNWQDLQARPAEDGTRPVLYQRPEYQASLAVDWIFAADWDLFLEIERLGTALDEDETGAVVELPSATRVNLRLFRTLHHDDAGRWRLYAGVDNLGDTVVLPQLGLPRPGRTTSVGVSFEQL